MGGLSGARLFATLIASSIVATGAVVSAAHAAELLRNGGFREGADGVPAEWRNEAWTRQGVEFSWTPPAGDAISSANIHNVAPNDTRWCQTIAVQPGATYRVATRVRTDDVGVDASGAHIAIEPRIGDSVDVRGTTDWRRLEIEARAGEERQWDVCLRVGSYANLNTGTAWFSDVTVVQLGAPATMTTSTSGPGIIQRLLAWTGANGFRAAIPLLGGALLAFGFGFGRRYDID